MEETSTWGFLRFNRIFFSALSVQILILIVLYEVRTYYVQIQPNPQDYLASIRESTVPGCSSFGLRKPPLLVVGDSHSYAAWNYNLASKLLGREDIGACTMSGMRMASWQYLIDRMDRDASVPRVLVYGAAPLHFYINVHKYKEQLRVHEDWLRGNSYDQFWKIDLGIGLRWALSTMRNKALGRGPFYGYANFERSLRTHTPLIEKVSDERTDQIISSYSNVTRKLWEKVIPDEGTTPDPAVDAMIDDVCSWVKSRKILLYVWTTPETRYLDRMYNDGQRALFRRYVDRFAQCATVLHGSAADWGVSDRHFVNRLLKDDFPYEWFDANSRLPSSAEIEARMPDPSNLYDLDHLNPVGATILTEHLIKRMMGPQLSEAIGPSP